MSGWRGRRPARQGVALASAVALCLAGCGGAVAPSTPPSTAPADGAAADAADDAATGAAAAPSAAPATALRFTDATAASGLDGFRHAPGYSPDKFMPEIMGPGIALADVNRDGAPDLVVTNSGAIGQAARAEGASNRLYLNDGAGRFRDATAEWGLPSPGYGMGVAAGDWDNDGWVDLFLTAFGGGDTLLRNTGAGFVDATAAAGLVDDGGWSMSAGFFDADGDGDLDLWVVRYAAYDVASAIACYSGGAHVYCTPEMVAGTPDTLWRNNGDGTFSDVSEPAGLRAQAPTRGLALVLGDVELDGDVDAYIANDLDRNELWLNDGRGRFTDVGAVAGVAYSSTGAEEAGMGADLGDLNGDGRPDLVSANFQGESASTYLQEAPPAPGHVLFREASDAMGIGAPMRARLKWGVDIADLDHDADADLVVANGHLYDNVSTLLDDVTFGQPNSVLEQLPDGGFRDVSSAAGTAFAAAHVSRGLATGDVDGDGDLDLVFANNGGPLELARNDSAAAGAWLGLWLEGDPAAGANRSAVGARVEAAAAGRTVTAQVLGASSYLSAHDPRLVLGLADAAAADVVIRWPGGGEDRHPGLAAGRWYRVVQGQPPAPFTPGAQPIAP